MSQKLDNFNKILLATGTINYMASALEGVRKDYQTAVYISKDGVELKSYGGGFKFAVQSSIDYLNRINNIG